MKINHGTEVADGAWELVKQARRSSVEVAPIAMSLHRNTSGHGGEAIEERLRGLAPLRCVPGDQLPIGAIGPAGTA